MITPLRVVIADDHIVVREGLQMFLAETPDEVEVVGQASDGAEAIIMIEALRPDVVIMDLVMPRVDGIEAIRRLRQRGNETPVLVLTTFADGGRVGEAIGAGAIGYLLKDIGRSDLLAAVRAAARGQPTLHPAAQHELVQHLAAPQTSAPFGALTARERDVLRLIAAGCSNKRIATELSISLGTVKGYVSSILDKLNVADRTQAALFAVRNGIEGEPRDAT